MVEWFRPSAVIMKTWILCCLPVHARGRGGGFEGGPSRIRSTRFVSLLSHICM